MSSVTLYLSQFCHKKLGGDCSKIYLPITSHRPEQKIAFVLLSTLADVILIRTVVTMVVGDL